MGEQNSTASALLAFFSKPVVGILGSVASLMGIALSIYFFLASQEMPELTYFVHPAKAAVVRTGQTSRLSVQFDDEKLTGDVTAAQIAFWNAGRKPIRSGAILSPLIIRTGDKSRILEARLQKASRDIVGVTLDTSRLAAGEVEVRWNILELNDGGVLQIVYAGDETVVLEAQAILEGQPQVVRLDYSRTLSTPGEEYSRRQGWKGQLPNYINIAMGLAMALLMLRRLLALRREGRSPQTREWITVLMALTMVAMGIWLLMHDRAPAPPFGF